MLNNSEMISIVIPTYNEAENIAGLVTFLKEYSNKHVCEILVSDGGSTDDTVKLALEAGANAFLSPKKGRAAQMNHGASVAKGNILYFVHADTLPPKTFAIDINTAYKAGFNVGRYRTTFNSSKFILKLNAFFTRFDWFICYGGDQTLFISKLVFEKLHGFDQDMLIMEDYDIVARSRGISKYKVFKDSALVSARKYDLNSWLTVQLAHRTIIKMYKQGATQQAMLNKYKELLVFK